MEERWFTATATTGQGYKYNWFTDEILEFVRNVKSEEDAVENLKRIMKRYENSRTIRDKFKRFLTNNI